MLPVDSATPVSIFWFRRDLRLEDNAALYYALRSGLPVLTLFIFDTNILDDLAKKNDKRVSFIYDAVHALHCSLGERGSGMLTFHGTPEQGFDTLRKLYNIRNVFANEDYEPYARERDRKIEVILRNNGVEFRRFKDHVVFEKDEILRENGDPYTIYTPYSRKWKEKLNSFYLRPYPVYKYLHNLAEDCQPQFPAIESLGFVYNKAETSLPHLSPEIALQYHLTRDLPGIYGTTRLGVHLRFGTISIRHFALQALEWNDKLLNELIWRDFYQAILWHFPHVVDQSFKIKYDRIPWRNDEKEFEAWKTGNTGYPIVDAGMRELMSTGYMHNRVRMITASFLTKHLLVDWRWGEAFFAELLMDYDLAANNGGWQWAAGCGCDAAPYFRIFNPTLQTEKYDPNRSYIRKWVPEFEGFSYPEPIVNHEVARKRCLDTFTKALNS